MKKLLGRILACAIVSATCSAAFSSCSLTTTEGEEIDETKTQLEIGNMDRGLGDQWLNAVIGQFEEAYKDYEGADGKKGVQVVVTNKQDEFSTSSLIANMPYNGIDLYIVANSSYATLYTKQYDGASILADLSDIVKAQNYDEKGNLTAGGAGATSIESRMAEAYKNYYDISSDGSGKYYALPFFSTAVGGIYDADFFNEAGFYFLKSGEIGASQKDIDEGKCDVGPDGIEGTYDDGMPKTWEQFKKLMNAIVNYGGTPFIWDGLNTYERSYFFEQIYANYEGANDFNLLITLNGTDSEFGAINEDNAWQLGGQQGRLAANRAIKDIMSSNQYYSEDAMKASTTHTNAQMLYLQSIEKNKRIAMFMEGSWWENEARDVFDKMSLTEESWGHGKRDFRILPIPNFAGTTLATAEETGGAAIVSEQNDRRQVMVLEDAGGSAIFISNQSKQKELAKEFVKFMHSRQMLVLMTQKSSCFRPFEYEFTPEEFAACTKFTQSMLTMKNDVNTDVVWAKGKRNSVIEQSSVLSEKWTSEEVFTTYFSGGNPYRTYLNTRDFYKQNWPKK